MKWVQSNEFWVAKVSHNFPAVDRKVYGGYAFERMLNCFGWFTNSFQEHCTRLENVFKKLAEAAYRPRNFDYKVVRELCKLFGIKKTRTTPYHPIENGSVERFNQTLLKMLGTLEHDQKADFKSHVARLLQAYNATKSGDYELFLSTYIRTYWGKA